MTLLGNESAGTGNQGTGQGNAGSSGAGNSGAGGTGAAGQSGGSGNAGGGGTPSWRDSLPDDLKSNATLAAYTDVASLAKSHIHAQSLIGKKGVFVPGEKSTDEDWKAFYKSVGQPELDKFEVKIPDGTKVVDGFVDQFKKTAHESGLLPKQAQGLIDWYLKHEQENQSNQAKEVKLKGETELAALKKEWGDGYGKQVALARLGVEQVGGQEFQKYLDQSGLGNNTQLIKFMSRVGAVLGEDKLKGDGAGTFGKTPSELQSEIDKIRSHPGYADRNHGDHGRLNREIESLYRSLYSPEQKSG